MQETWTKILRNIALSCLIFSAGAFSAGLATKASTGDNYKYKCISVPHDPNNATAVQTAVDANARDGWRLVTASESVFAFPGSGASGYTLLVFEKK